MSMYPLGPEIRAYVKHVCLPEVAVGVVRTIVEKSIKTYIEWCSENAKRIDFGPLYEHIMILKYSNTVTLGPYSGHCVCFDFVGLHILKQISC